MAAVVLLIAIAGAILGSASRDRDVTAGSGSSTVQGNAVLANEEQASEPLSDLGVVPSTGNEQAPQP